MAMPSVKAIEEGTGQTEPHGDEPWGMWSWDPVTP